MNIKSIMLGSAAAMVAVSGARAADAIVFVEPEPVEYVRVCDVYGSGFFYIPGTETCLRIGGEVRHQVTASSARDPFEFGAVTPFNVPLFTLSDFGFAPVSVAIDPFVVNAPFFVTDGAVVLPASVFDPFTSAFVTAPGIGQSIIVPGTDTPGYYGSFRGFSNQSRGRFFIDARSETEWGTLRGYIRVDADRNDGANGIRTNKAFVELGGLKIGWDDSAWAFTPNAGAGNFGSYSDGGLYYGYQQRHFIQYNLSTAGGFFATLSVEFDNEFDNYTPDFVGKVGFTQAWGTVWGMVAYDSDINPAFGVVNLRLPSTAGFFFTGPTGIFYPTEDDGWSAVAGVHVNFPGYEGASARLLGYYSDSDNAYGTSSALGVNPEWSVMGAVELPFTPTFGVSVGAQYFHDLYLPQSSISTDIDAWAAEFVAVWTPVENFTIRTEIVYDKVEDLDGTWSGFMRFSRFF